MNRLKLIADTPPTIEVDVLVWTAKGFAVARLYADGNWWPADSVETRGEGPFLYAAPTHWMPLPKEPESE